MTLMELISSLSLSAGRDWKSDQQRKIIIFVELRKRWLLFPPDSPIGQLQTRIPYEESSVYLDIEPSVLKKYQVKQHSFDQIIVIFLFRILMSMMLSLNQVMSYLFRNIGGIMSRHLIQSPFL